MKAVMRKTLLAAVLAATAGQALAADSIDVKVTGEIVPAGCTPIMAGGSTIDYGTIKADTIAKNDFTVLPVKSVSFSINCGAPAKVALRSGDIRTDTAVKPIGKSLLGTNITSSSLLMGLGSSNGKNIGAYVMAIAEGVVLDGSNAATDVLYSMNQGTTWSKASFNNVWLNGNTGQIYTWAKPGSLTPQAFTTMTGTLNVQASINKGSELDLTQKVTLDGLSSISLIYL